MKTLNPRFLKMLLVILVIIVAIVLLFVSFSEKGIFEGLETVPLVIDSSNHVLRGYYQVTDKKMALLPYGFDVDPLDNKKIIPKTQTGISALKPKYNPPIPKKGEKMPDGFYLTKQCSNPQACTTYDLSLAILPPNMSPKLVKIDVSGNPANIIYHYEPGYVSDTQYYENIYAVADNLSSLPNELYYKDKSRKSVSFLQYGQIADPSNGYGFITDPNLNLSAKQFNYGKSNYRDISNNYDIEFHNDASSIIQQNNMYDLEFGQTRVLDQNGNMIILPKTNSQGNVTYYQPGEFPFGAANYVPNYEDSVYLSSVGYRTMFDNKKS